MTREGMSEQVWFVTGSSRGLGRALAEAALDAGHQVAVTARSTASLTELPARYGKKALLLPLDVTDLEQVAHTVKVTVEAFGRIDVVVNNVSRATIAPVEHVPIDDFRAQVEAIFYGTVNVTKAALPVFRDQGSGHFIQVASAGGRLTTPGLSAFHAAKHAIEGFSKVLAKEVSRLGIRVTIAEPGAMRTNWGRMAIRTPPIDPAYDRTVGTMISRTTAAAGYEPVDPAKVARTLLDVAALPEPPLHLVLGRDAVDEVQEEVKRQLHEDSRWAWIGRSVDFV